MKNKFVYLLFFIFIILVMATSRINSQDSSTADEFALHLKDLITSNEVIKFKELPCYPSGCSYLKDEIEYIFGSERKPSVIENILNLENLEIKIYGPYTFSEDAINQSYSLVYYDPTQVTFTEDGHMTHDTRVKLWWKGYVETVVILVDGKWGFHYAPFYYGTDALPYNN